MIRTLVLFQLPVPQPAAFSASGNVPLAAGALGVAARIHGLDSRCRIHVVSPELTDDAGDAELVEHLLGLDPDWIGASLYLWNSERSLHLLREVKARRPSVLTLVGGPEVATDNPWILDPAAVDIAVTGEAEPTFVQVIASLLDGNSPVGVPGVSVRNGDAFSPFNPVDPPSFPLSAYPSPYADGTLPVHPDRSTYVETVRGCRSHCTFCFYPRSSANLRSLTLGETEVLFHNLRERGAKSVVFLDPTFNHRAGFEDLLEILQKVNADRHFDFFAEVRAEGLREDHARALREAGFNRLEIGLQSVSDHTLKLTRRHGSARLVAEAAAHLHKAGIQLLVDLIIGLPGDTPDDVRRGFDFLKEHGLGDEAQVFLLSVLPGTAMRTDAVALGLAYDPRPPYRVLATPTMDLPRMTELLLEAEAHLGRRLDEWPRPHLVDPSGSKSRDVRVWNVDDPVQLREDADAPMARHAVVWVEGHDLWAARDRLVEALRHRMARDPYCTLDVVLRPKCPFPLDLIEVVRTTLAEGTPNYLSRVLAHRGENAQRRLVVSLRADVKFPKELGLLLLQQVPVYRDMSLEAAAAHAAEHGEERPLARVIGSADPLDPHFRRLVELADPDAISFADRDLELFWTRAVLELSER